MSSEFLHHEQCPNCGSQDNLGRYSDGHAFCFGCGYKESPLGTMANLGERLNKNNNNKNKYDLVLPVDYSSSIHPDGLGWLSKYKLTHQEIRHNHIGWSDEGIYLKKKEKYVKPMLVFPVYDPYGNLLLWQGRYFGKEEGIPKYTIFGYKEEVFHILECQTTTRLVLTEDLISAIKVGRVCNAMPIFGSTVSLERLRTLSKRFNRLTLWLDCDKAIESKKQALRASQYFDKVDCIITANDPKEYTTKEIEGFLNE